jgi:hypothetical protein
MNWESKLTKGQWAILRELGYYRLPDDHNPITRALENGEFMELCGHLDIARNRTRMSRLAVICQMAVYDQQRGPDGDGCKGLRRQWYSWFKTRFAQPYHGQVDPDSEFNGTQWAGRMSQTYGWLVDNASVTYKDLWVDDASRMMERWHERLFYGCHIVVAVEKDSLFADFKAAAHALGAVSLLSGKGKNSKAATEKMLREHFGWDSRYDPFTADEPLIVLHISDHDFDGEAVIGPTFGEQARRYTSHILEARVGVKPEHVDDWQGSWYDVKVNNSGYIKWSEEKALFLAECFACGYFWPVIGLKSEGAYIDKPHTCPECGRAALPISVDDNQPHGFEVEALPTRAYYVPLVKALLEVLPFEYIVSKLRDECQANANWAAGQIRDNILAANDSYQALLKEFDRLEEIKAEFEQRVQDELEALGAPHIDDWRNDGDDPEPADFERHVKGAQSYTGPWRPFSERDRTTSLVEHLRENESDTISDFENEIIEW